MASGDGKPELGGAQLCGRLDALQRGFGGSRRLEGREREQEGSFLLMFPLQLVLSNREKMQDCLLAASLALATASAVREVLSTGILPERTCSTDKGGAAYLYE